MDCKIMLILLLALTATTLPSDARAAEKCLDKFAFPPHLIGTNDSMGSILKTYTNKYHPVDIGVDNLDDHGPVHIREALANATMSEDPSLNQYTEHDGLPRLRRAIAEMYSPLIGHQLNPDDNVLVTVGANEAVYSTITGHTFEGDEWLVVEPAYTIYLPIIQQAKGIAQLLSLKLEKHNGSVSGDDWKMNENEFERLLSRKTKGIILNNPQNPIGKVWSLEELQFVGRMAQKYNLLIISDEAHEWITFKPHIRTALLAGLYERTITIGSASKTFSLGGWRIGWAFGPKHLLDHAKTVHALAVSKASTPQQDAIAFAFEQEIRNFGLANSYFVSHKLQVKQLRDFLSKAFVDAGLETMVVDGGYCIFVDWSPLRRKLPQLHTSLDFVVWLIENVGVAGLPGGSYYGSGHEYLGDNYARFCYHKKYETLEEAARRLQKLKQFLI